MTPPAPSQCRRALQRQIVPSRDSVWITEGLLASAFERYCQISRTWNRKASNVPGPLESQRRLGRRRIGAASTWHCPPTPPSWALLGPLNLSQWTWKPPSLVHDAERNRPRHDDTTHAQLSSLLPQWVRELASQEPDERPIALTDAASPEAHLPPNTATRADPYAAVMDDFRWAARHADDATLTEYTIEMRKKLRQGIILGEITPDDIVRLSNEIWETLESRLRGSPLCHRLSLSFCEAIMSGLTTSKVFSPTLLDVRFWHTLLTQMSKFPCSDRLCNLVIEVMHTMPMDRRPHVSEGILSVLGSFFSAWSRSSSVIQGRDTWRLLDMSMLGELYNKPEKLSALPACLRQASIITKALDCSTPEETKALLTAAHRLVISEATALAKGRGNLRYSWLYVLAHMPHVNQDFLFEAAASLSEPSLNMRPLSGIEISSLLLTQWMSRGYLPSSEEVYRSYRKYCGKRDKTALASLFLAVFYHGRGKIKWGLYYGAWKFLFKLKRTDDVIQSLAFSGQTGNLPVAMLQILARTSNDHRMVIRLRDLWSNHLRTKDQPQWDPSMFKKHAKAIVHDPEIPANEIWRVLDIGKLERKGATLQSKIRDHRGTFGHDRAAVVEKVSGAFMTAQHLSDRAVLRHVSRSFAFLRLIRGKVPESVVMALYRLVTKDLWEQKPGRTKRLLWFLRLVERKHGLEVAWSCRLALRRWRARLTKVWLSKGGGRKE